jgi:Na+-driven multidrug efflux pump
MGLIALVMVMGMVISCAIPQQLMGLFTTSRTTMEIGGAALRIISFGFAVSSVSVTFSGVLEGLGKGMPSLLISLARYIVVMTARTENGRNSLLPKCQNVCSTS